MSEDEATTTGTMGPGGRTPGEPEAGSGPDDVVDVATPAEPEGLTEEERRRRTRGIVALSIVIGIVVALMAVGGSMLTDLVGRTVPDKDDREKTTTTAAPTTVPPAPALEDGMSCQQLAEAGLAYWNVMAYWLRTGSEDALDKDGDGRPCDEAFDEGAVDDFTSLAASLPKRATCQDLVDASVTYPDVVAYWLRRDRSSKLLAEGADFPCTDVYPAKDVDAFFKFDT